MASISERTILSTVTDEEVDTHLDDNNSEIIIAGSTFYASAIMKQMDEVAYEQIRNDLAEEVIEYSCDECGCEYDNEFDAECCCDIEDEEY